MKHLYISLFALVGIVASAQEVSWQKNIKSNTQDFLSQLTTTIDGKFLLSGSSIQRVNQQNSTSNQNNGILEKVVDVNGNILKENKYNYKK